MNVAEKQNFARRLSEIRKIEKIIPSEKRAEHDIRDIAVGGVLSLYGKTYRVLAVATYTETDDLYAKEKSYVATEYTLFCLETGETHYIEWGVDDEVEISFTQKKLSRSAVHRNLAYDDGEIVDVDDMDEIFQKGWDVIYDGTTFSPEDDWPARYVSDDGRSLYVYFYEFESARGEQLTVEAWSDEPDDDGKWEYEIYLSSDVSTNSVQILSLGG